MASNDVNISLDQAHQLVVDILLTHNTDESNAHSVAQALVAAEVDGQKGHGLSRLSSYAAQAESGKIMGHAKPEVVAHKGNGFRIDAQHGFAFPACELALTQLSNSAPQNGLSAASIFNSHHFGQAGYHAERLAMNGLVGLVFSNSPHAIAPWGGQKGLFGTNPIAFAAPRADELPLLIDLSLSKVARGKVMVAKQVGESIPHGWALDSMGQPTDDPEQALNGTMLPMGEAKGAALVLMVEIMAASLSGAHYGYEASSFFTADGPAPGVGHFILALDPEFFSGGIFIHRLETLISEMQAQQGVRVPGSRRGELRSRAQKQGLMISENLMDEIHRLRK